MATKKGKGKGRRKRSRSSNNKSFFMASKAQNLEQYIIASMLTGMFTAAGAVLGTVLAKYVLSETDKIVPLPQSLHAAINTESAV